MEQWRENRSLYASNYGSQYYNGDTLKTKWDDNWDCRKYPSSSNEDDGDDKPKTQRPTATRYLYLIRHGQYVMADQSEKKILTEIGRHQAALTGKRLSQLGIPYTALHHSTMVRAVETAAIISDSLPDVPVKTCQTLCEGAPILPEPEVTHWTPKPWQFFQDGARIENAFRQYFHRAPPEQKEDSHEIIVCHANVIRYFVCRSVIVISVMVY
jgi:serine/threonine-protein phosphatase PGAM5